MDIELLRECGRIVAYEKDEVICREGEEGHSMFILLEGNVEVRINSFSDNAKVVSRISKGSFFGEMSLLEKKSRSASVFVTSDMAVLLEIREENFEILLSKAPSIAYSILKVLNKRLNVMLDRIWETDKRFIYNYRKDATYNLIQKLDEEGFEQIAQGASNNVWVLLKYLSTSLEYLNGKYISDVEK